MRGTRQIAPKAARVGSGPAHRLDTGSVVRFAKTSQGMLDSWSTVGNERALRVTLEWLGNTKEACKRAEFVDFCSQFTLVVDTLTWLSDPWGITVCADLLYFCLQL